MPRFARFLFLHRTFSHWIHYFIKRIGVYPVGNFMMETQTAFAPSILVVSLKNCVHYSNLNQTPYMARGISPVLI